jgi:hypothetical protein
LGDFIWTNKVILQEGLLGGTTSAAWPLLRLAETKAKLKYEGLKKVDGQELHRLDYKPRKGGGKLQIQMFFEPETFRHVQTAYRLRIPAPMANTPDASAGMLATDVAVIESFSNFRAVDGLNLPANWKIHMDRSSQGSSGPGSFVAEWEMGFTSVVHNQPIDAAYYQMGAKATERD